MRSHEDVPNRDACGAEAPTEADDTRQNVAPRNSQNRSVARVKLRAAALSWSITPAEIDHILDRLLIEKAGTMLWQARRHGAAGALSVAGSSDQRGSTAQLGEASSRIGNSMLEKAT
jgi:hypothetical protein